MKKVLYVSNRTGYSGAEVVLLRLIENNTEVEPIVLAPHGLLTERLQNIGVKVYFSNNIFQLNRKQNRLWVLQIIKNLVLGFFEFAMVMIKEKPNIVHANGLGASIYSSIPAWFFRKPFLWTDHDVFSPGSIESNWTKRLSVFSKRIITVSHFVENSLLRVGINKKKIITIYNGLDYSRFDPEKVETGFMRKKLKISSNKKIIALFALITPWKGHHLVVNAVRKLGKQGRKDFVVVFVGETDDENYRWQLEERVRKFKLKEYVKFLGFVNDPVLAYKDVDILLNASVKPEPLGTTIYEGMAMERLILASRIGGNPEIIEDGKTGFLFKPRDLKNLTDRINYCLENEANLGRIKKQARQEAKKKFSLSTMVSNYNKIYDLILSN